MIHCHLYYVLDDPVVTDHEWARMAQHLAKLQARYGWEIGFYDREFKDWDGSSGFHLQADADVKRVAERLLRESKERDELLT